MENGIEEIEAFRVTIERRRLARDEKCIRQIFEILEECGIPCECMAINIDWLSIVIRESERGKLSGFMMLVGQRLSRINVSVNGNVTLLSFVDAGLDCRGIGMVVSSLTMQDIEIIIQRYLQRENRLVIGVMPEDAARGCEIIEGIVDSGYRI